MTLEVGDSYSVECSDWRDSWEGLLGKQWNLWQWKRNFNKNKNLLGSWYKIQTPRPIPETLIQQVFGNCDSGDSDAGSAQTTI